MCPCRLTADMMDCKPATAPAVAEPLGSDPDGPPFKEAWSFRSVAGVLLHLSGNSRPDISLAVSQICRFTSEPKESHGRAVEHLLRHLKGTVNQGTVVHSDGTLDLDNCCDAEFGGLFASEHQDDPMSAVSRHGHIIFLGNCPLIWRTQLMSEIAASSAHSECVALSASLRVQLVLKWMLEELKQGLGLAPHLGETIHARAFEDNNSALLLAANQRTAQRTRFHNQRWHWFWNTAREGLITVSPVNAKDQRADGPTKSLPKEAHERVRKLVQGWQSSCIDDSVEWLHRW